MYNTDRITKAVLVAFFKYNCSEQLQHKYLTNEYSELTETRRGELITMKYTT